MKILHPAAIGGLLLNALIVFLVIMGANSVDPADLGMDSQMFADLMGALRPILILLLLTQGTALLLLTRGMLLGLIMGCVAGAFMLPIGLVFILGCVLSYYNVKYQDFATPKAGYQGARRVFRSGLAFPFWMASAGCGLLMLTTSYTGFANLSVSFCGFALGLAYLAFRVSALAPLALFQDYFTITPSPVARRIALPYEHMLRATLYDNGGIQFDVQTPRGERSLVWSLNLVRKEERRDALEALGKTLAEHNVPLL